VTAADPFRCICDPDNIFEPPDPKPVAVEGCPAHQARRAYQQFVLGMEHLADYGLRIDSGNPAQQLLQDGDGRLVLVVNVSEAQP
jgi:hypothetical protein